MVKAAGFWVCIMLYLSSCAPRPDEGPLLRVTLYDELGRYENASPVLIASHDGFTDTLFISNRDRHGFFTLPVRRITERFDTPVDILNVQFALSIDNEIILNEEIVRPVSLRHLIENEPLFTYGKPDLPDRETEVTFRVNMSNQKVLGFFVPVEGDRVVVSGNMFDSPTEGLELHSEGGSNYSATVHIRYFEGDPLTYRYRIITDRNTLLPYKGWESVGERRFEITENTTELTSVYFSDQRRVVRFVIDERRLKRQVSEDDVLRVRLWLDGRKTHSDVLIRVYENLWETALLIPLSVQNIEWVLTDGTGNGLTYRQSLVVDFNGKTITR